MRSNQFMLPGMGTLSFSVSHTVLDAGSPLNQHEPHVHKEWEIYVNLSGEVAFAVGNRIYSIRRGSVVLTRPYEYHHCIYRSNALHEHYWITFSVPAGEWDAERLFFGEKGDGKLIVLEPAALDALCSTVDTLLEKGIDPISRRLNFLRLIQLLCEGSNADGVPTADDLPEEAVLAMAYMEAHLEERIAVKQLADAAYVSVSTLERRFRDAFGVSPMTMLTSKRLISSMRFLRQGCSVAQAGSKSGFTDESNYIQLFCRRFGMTPREYKKQFEAGHK